MSCEFLSPAAPVTSAATRSACFCAAATMCGSMTIWKWATAPPFPLALWHGAQFDRNRRLPTERFPAVGSTLGIGTPDGSTLYALSDSGFMVLPVSTIYNSPIAVP